MLRALFVYDLRSDKDVWAIPGKQSVYFLLPSASRLRVFMANNVTSDVVPRTSEVPFFSSLHGRQRRHLRGIDRKDLQAAIKYGKKEPGWPDPVTGAPRWKYTWANIVYIADETSTKEVTSYAEPISIPRAELTPDDIAAHEAAKKRLADDPSLRTSHTVIGVDQSGSMRTSDVFDFKDRSKAVFGMLALDFVAERCQSREMTETDLVSLVLMRDEAEVAFEREPMGLVLYNRLVELHESGAPRSHGNFMPALEEVERLLGGQHHGEGCALSLFFLSDGKPSDHVKSKRKGGPPALADSISARLKQLVGVVGYRLSVSTFGFACREQDFSVLESMAQAARDAGATGQFYRPELSTNGLSTSITRGVSSLLLTKLAIEGDLPGEECRPRKLRKVEREVPGTWSTHTDCVDVPQEGAAWRLIRGVQRYELSPRLKYRGLSPWIPVDFLSPDADSIAIRVKYFGEGVERVVSGLQVRVNVHEKIDMFTFTLITGVYPSIPAMPQRYDHWRITSS